MSHSHFLVVVVLSLSLNSTRCAWAADLPAEPLAIGTEPQFVFDRHVIDNQWAVKYKSQRLERVFHQPKKHDGNPLIAGEGNHVQVRRRADGLYQMWYDLDNRDGDEIRAHAIGYAESPDGLAWTKPNLGLFERNGSKANNVCWPGIGTHEARTFFPLDLPEAERRGFEHVMLFRSKRGLHLIGSHDGIHWDDKSVAPIYKLHSDTHNNLLHDPQRGEYVMYCRPKHIYRTFQGDVLDTGESRRIARLTSRDLWTAWSGEPQTILTPDELDERAGFNCFYGMPTVRYGGLYWGALWCFKMNNDIHTELAWSRDGISYERHPDRPKLIERGPEGSWDDGMAFGQFPWVEVGDEWHIYYNGWDGPHEARSDVRKIGVGLAVVRKEGFISMRGPKSGGVLVTRKLIWPGGDLTVNADASAGELKVRVSDAGRKPLAGFNYEDCTPLTTDGTAQPIRWNNRTLDELRGQTVRLEFFLRDADLYTFRATGN
ncbi:MAG: hypothetical protein JNK76_16815 [Planctomycetales bacterium]|nr:hypothetical protein [Planctomycetales bacterium]MBN8626243.1 hypothetical protein [Planctomycetota bacterium]